MTEICKTMNHLNPQFKRSFRHIKKCKYELGSEALLDIPTVCTITYGINSVCFKAYLFWNSLTTKTRLCETLEVFRAEIKS